MSSYRGVVSHVSTEGTWVTVADLVPEFPFGPVQHVGATPPEVGASVLVVDVGSPAEPDLIVVGELAEGMPT